MPFFYLCLFVFWIEFRILFGGKGKFSFKFIEADTRVLVFVKGDENLKGKRK
jgi:hypothetical protein